MLNSLVKLHIAKLRQVCESDDCLIVNILYFVKIFLEKIFYHEDSLLINIFFTSTIDNIQKIIYNSFIGILEDNYLKTNLLTYHDLQAIPIIRSFAGETGKFFGANDKEALQLEIAAEEASAFIINSLKPDFEQLFEISIETFEKGVRFYFRNKGLPIDKDNLPEYDSKNPSKSIDGLPFRLIETLTDSMSFKNEGDKGWVLIFEKQLKNFKPPIGKPNFDNSIAEQCAKEKLNISIATKEDAYNLVKLTYLTYRYSYAKKLFYYPEELAKAIEEKRIISFIAKNKEGDVVINSAYMRSPECPEIAEAGMLMSRPEYRKNRTLLKLSRTQIKYVKDETGGIKIAYSKLVTSHTKSQRLTHSLGFFPLAIECSVHEQAEFIAFDIDKNHRESLLYALFAPNGLDNATIYVPSEHIDISVKLFENFKNIRFSDKITSYSNNPVINIVNFEKDRFCKICIESFGENWLKTLKRKVKERINDGIITIQLQIYADKPLPEGLEEGLKKIGFLFSGIIIRTTNKWKLLYNLLIGQHFNFDKIMLSHENSILLREYIKKQYEELI